MAYLNNYCASLNLRQKNPTWECGKTKKLQLCFVRLFYRHQTDKQWQKITFFKSIFHLSHIHLDPQQSIRFTPRLLFPI